MRRNCFVAVCLFVVSGLLAVPLSAQDWDHDPWNGGPWQFQQSPRGPLGVYVKVDVEDAISEYNAIMEPTEARRILPILA